MSVSFIIPTFNEKDNILRLIDKIITYAERVTKDYEIVVVDDNSPDQTGSVCKAYYGNNKKIRVCVRKSDRGFASAICYGIKRAKKDYVLVMDADFSHDPKLIPVILNKINKYNVVLASRYIKNGGGENRKRFLLSKIYNAYLNLLLRVNISDFLFGYFCIRREYLIKNKLVTKSIFNGFGDYFIRLAYQINKSGGTFFEIPAYYKNRTYGVSKSNLINMLITYTITSLQTRFKDFN